jgi:hypothetical protein
MLIYSYLIAGVIISAAGVGAYAWVFAEHGLYLHDLVMTAEDYWMPTSEPFCPHPVMEMNGTIVSNGTCFDAEQQVKKKRFD